MDFRMRQFKENKQNYNSMVQFPKNNDFLSSQTPDRLNPNKIIQIESRLNQLIELKKIEQQNNNVIFTKLHQRIDTLQHKIVKTDLNGSIMYNNNQLFKDTRNSSPFKNNNNSQDITYFKQTVISDINAQKEEIHNQLLKNQQIQRRQLRLEQDLRDWITKHNQQINMRLNQNQDLRGNEFNKQKKNQFHYQSIKNTVLSLERKFQEQIQLKFRSLGSLKQQLGQSIQIVRQELTRQNKNDKQIFSKLVREIKQSFQNLKDALGQDRQHVKQAIFQLQTNHQNTANKINRTIEHLSQSSNQKHQKLEKKVVILKDDWNSYKLSTNQRLEDYKTLVMKIQSVTLQNLQNNKNPSKDSESFDNLKEELAEWKKLTQQKNLNVFREISNAMKIFRMEWRKQHDDLTKQFEDTSKSIKHTKQSINKRIDKQIGTITQLMTEQFDALTLEFEEMNQLIALSKKEVDDKFFKEIGGLKDSLSTQSIQAIRETEKKIVAFQTKMQITLAASMTTFTGQLSTLQKKLNNDIQNLTKNIEEDSQNRQKQLKEVSKKLKDSFNKQLQTVSSNNQKQQLDRNKKIQASIQSLKKSVEAGLSSERGETVKQISKVTQQITSLIGDWSSKIKKERQNGETAIKLELNSNKKIATQGISQLKLLIQDFKNKSTAKSNEQSKKTTQLKASIDQSIAKIAKSQQQESLKISKKLQTLKTQLQGKIKMGNDKILLEINMKKQAQIKAKEDESKNKSSELQKKIVETNTKVKNQLSAQIAKMNKYFEQQSSKTNKKIDGISTVYKKQLQGQVEKQRKFCTDEITKAKNEIQTKLKAKDEKFLSEANSKKEAESKQKQQEFKTKLAQVSKKVNEDIAKLKIDIDSKMKILDDQKSKKEADSKLKQNELKQKQLQIKNKSAELDKKIQILKKQVMKSTMDQLLKLKAQLQSKIKTQFDIKIQTYTQQSQSKLKTTNENLLKLTQQYKTKVEQLNKKIQQIKQEVNKKLSQLKGVSAQKLKAQQQQSIKIQDQRQLTLKRELNKIFSEKSVSIYKQNQQKMKKLTEYVEKIKSELLNASNTNKEIVSKVEANILIQKQKNKAVYDKMSSDILDIADSMMVLMSQLKPAQK